MSFLPIEKEIYRLPKQYLVNIVYTVVGETFAQWVRDRIEERNKKVAIEKDLMIKVDDKIAEVFFGSTAVSL